MNEFARNARELKVQNRKAKAERERILSAWKVVLKLPEGRLVLLDLLDQTRPLMMDFDASPSTYNLGVRDGKRMIGLGILERLEEVDASLIGPFIAEPFMQRRRETLEREREKDNAPKKDEDAEADT